MCGIFGVISSQTVDPGYFRAIGGLNTVRGNRSFGVLTVAADGSIGTTHRLTPFQADQPDQVALENVQIALGHVRAPTDGNANDIMAVHPFQTPDLWMAHNGLLLNHMDHDHWRLPDAVKIDSTVLVGGIQHHLDLMLPIDKAIRHTVESLDGQQACWVWYIPNRMIYLWRVMSPIYVAQSEYTVTFSSIRSGASDRLLDEGVIYQIDPATVTVSTIGTFNYHNPFKVRT